MLTEKSLPDPCFLPSTSLSGLFWSPLDLESSRLCSENVELRMIWWGEWRGRVTGGLKPACQLWPREGHVGIKDSHVSMDFDNWVEYWLAGKNLPACLPRGQGASPNLGKTSKTNTQTHSIMGLETKSWGQTHPKQFIGRQMYSTPWHKFVSSHWDSYLPLDGKKSGDWPHYKIEDKS